MAIKEIQPKQIGEEVPHRLWEIELANSRLTLVRFGNFCHWSIAIMQGDRERYRITLEQRNNGVDSGERNEYFDGKHERRYFGNQPSFVEYLIAAAQTDRIPDDFYSEWSSVYREKLKQILDLN